MQESGRTGACLRRADDGPRVSRSGHWRCWPSRWPWSPWPSRAICCTPVTPPHCLMALPPEPCSFRYICWSLRS